MAVTNSFTNGAATDAGDMNDNFTDLAGKIVYMRISGDDEDTVSTSYTVAYNMKFYFTNSDNITEIKFYVNLWASDSGTAGARIYNDTDAGVVTSSTVTTVSTSTDNWEISANLNANFPTSEKKYQVQLNNATAGKHAWVRNAYLKITYK